MKSTKFKFLNLFLLFVSITLHAAQTKSKEIHKEIVVNPNAIIEIDNQFGDLNISSWNENRVVIDILITVNGSNPKRIEEKLEEITVDFELSPDRVFAKTEIDEGWGFKWFNSSNVKYQIDYQIKLPRSSSVDLKNDFGTILINELEGPAKISCDYGKLLIGDLLNEQNFLSFDFTSNSTIDFIKGGEIQADYSGFEVEEAGRIQLKADFTNSKFNTIESLSFNNDYGKLDVGRINNLNGSGDFLTLRIDTLFKKLDIHQEYGSIRIDQINTSAENLMIDTEFTGITLGVHPDWEFSYSIELDFSNLKSNLPLQHLIQREESNKKFFEGFFKNEKSNHYLNIKSEFGSVKLQDALISN